MLYSESLLLIYFIYSLYLLIPAPNWSLPTSLSSLVTTNLFSVSVCLFMFYIYIHLYYFLDSTYRWYQIVFSFLSVWLISLSITLSRFIHGAANGTIYFLCPSNIPLYIYIHIYNIYTHISLYICMYTHTHTHIHTHILDIYITSF